MAAAFKFDYDEFEENEKKEKKKKKVLLFKNIQQMNFKNGIPPKTTPKETFSGDRPETNEGHKVKINSEDNYKISG